MSLDDVIKLLLFWVLLINCSCASSSSYIRGNLNSEDWTVDVCNSNKSYRVIFTSGGLSYFYDRIKELGLDETKPVMIEFIAKELPSPWLWNRNEKSVGIAEFIKVSSEKCGNRNVKPFRKENWPTSLE